MKKYSVIFLSLVLSILIVFGLPLLTKENDINVESLNEQSLVNQGVLSYSKNENEYYKIYGEGKLIGIISDYDYFESLIASKYQEYEEEFPNTSLGFNEKNILTKEKSFAYFENVDDAIFEYLVDNDLLGIKTKSVEFYTSEGVYDIIYVKSEQDFTNALNMFLLNFASEETLRSVENKEVINDPTEVGVVEQNVAIEEKIRYSEAVVSSKEIFDVEEIYEYLCYGRNESRMYYTTTEGDTLQSVSYYNGNMSTKQLVMINKDILSSENQILTPGTTLNVTYYTSPLTVVVTKKNLTSQYILPEIPEYIEDSELTAGSYVVQTPEESGLKNVLYKETWINGVLQSGDFVSENIIKQPIRGLVYVGTKPLPGIGTGRYAWPVDNPHVSCSYGCYTNHTGTDFINTYDHYGPAYVIDNGIVVDKGYKYDMGNYIIVDHQNGIRTFYMHLNVPAYVEVGDVLTRGQMIGQIGNTGRSDGAHLHLTFEVDGVRVNACDYLPCELLG